MAHKLVWIERQLLKSPAWRSLSKSAQDVYLTFLLKRKVAKIAKTFKVTNNGELVFTYADAKKELGMAPSTFMAAIDRLVAAGLIDITHSGSGGKKGDVSLYSISSRWALYGRPGFEAAERPKDTRGGRGFAYHPEHRYQRGKN